MIGKVTVRSSQFSKSASDLYGRIVDKICDQAYEFTVRRTPAGKELVVSCEDVLKSLHLIAQLYDIYVPPTTPSAPPKE